MAVNTGDAVEPIAGIFERRVRKREALQHSSKFMENKNAAVRRQTRMITGDPNIPQRISTRQHTSRACQHGVRAAFGTVECAGSK